MSADADNYWLAGLLVASNNLHHHDKVAVSKGAEEHTTAGMLRHRKPRNRRFISEHGLTGRLGEDEPLSAFWTCASIPDHRH